MNHRFVAAQTFCLLIFATCGSSAERLYNGIVLPNQWPPQQKHLPLQLPQPPYLAAPPKVIPIDVGRQLFVDDFLIEKTTMRRRFHKAIYYPQNPILTYDKPWEMGKRQGMLPTACPYSGGVWYDPAVKKFRMWYMAGYIEHLCLAESQDGIKWVKPKLDVRPGTNIVLPRGASEANSVIMDLNDAPQRRFKYFLSNIAKGWRTEYRTSPDGIHWSKPLWYSGPHGDRTTVFFNPFRKRYVFSLRTNDRSGARQGRSKKYWESADINDPKTVLWPASAPGKYDAQAPLWVSADRGLEEVRSDVGISPQLYHLDCVGYESLMVGFFNILRGDLHANGREGRQVTQGRPKCVEVCLGYSRDGFHWSRPTHQTFAGISERQGEWNWGNVQSTGNTMVVYGDYLYFYFSGRRGSGGKAAKSGVLQPAYAGCSTGLAILRRDGFASMTAGPKVRTLLTRPVRFKGNKLFVNLNCHEKGKLQVELLDEQGRVIEPFSRANCNPVLGNSTKSEVRWRGGKSLADVSGRPVRLRFYLNNGQLYSFWMSDTGASRGFVAGGGHEFPGHVDNSQGSSETATLPISAGPDIVVRDQDGDGKQTIELVGSARTIRPRYRWRLNSSPLAKTRRVRHELPVGRHKITLTVYDGLSRIGFDDVQVIVHPKTTPNPPRQGMVMWLKADSIAGLANGSRVIQWRDSSRNRLNASQKVMGSQPTWLEKSIGGRPALRFDGKDDYLLVDSIPGLLFSHSKSTIFVVVKPQGGGTIISQAHTNLAVTSGKNSRLVYGSGFATPGNKYVWPLISSKPSSMTDQPTLCCYVHAGDKPGQSALYVNGIRSDAGKTSIAYHIVSPISSYIGCGYQKRSPWKGEIAEMIVYSRAISVADRKRVESYLLDKYRLGKD